MVLIGYIEQLHCVGLKNRFLHRQIVTFQDNMSTKEEDNFSRSFRNAVHHALVLNLKTWDSWSLFRKKHCCSLFVERTYFVSFLPVVGNRWFFNWSLWCVRIYTMKSLIILRSALVESHIQELANYGILSCNLGRDGGLVEEEISQHSIVFTSSEPIVREERCRKLLQLCK